MYLITRLISSQLLPYCLLIPDPSAMIHGSTIAASRLACISLCETIHEHKSFGRRRQRETCLSRLSEISLDERLLVNCSGDAASAHGGWRDYGTVFRTAIFDPGSQLNQKLSSHLSMDKVVFAGTETSATGNMTDGWFAAWNGKTIQYISDHVTPSLEQRPNIILLHAGTNDMNPNGAISREGHDPVAASERLGSLVDKMTAMCPDAVILVAMIIGTCNAEQAPQTKVFQSLIPNVVAHRLEAGKHVLAVDFASFPLDKLRDCIHPTNEGYQRLGYYWYDFIAQIPRDWITAPVGEDPQRPEEQNLAMRLEADVLLLGLSSLLMLVMYA
ncbi:hypothetical protein TgHK011_004684 [Trichoderma gracile]|nr:hypothetical protein TgHK011_004684 [Trichoderma gracile]